MKKLFSYEFLDELFCGRIGEPQTIEGYGEYTVVKTSFVDKRRWALTWQTVFTDGIKFWSVTHSQPATENQECEQFNVDGDGMVECQEVVPVQVTVTNYEPVKGA